MVGGQGLEVGGPVVRGEGVEGAAVLGHLLHDLALAQRARALEHHVLDPVRYARDADVLIAGSHPVPHPEGDHGGRMDLFGDQGQAVGKGISFEGGFALEGGGLAV